MPEENTFLSFFISPAVKIFTVEILQEVQSKWETFTTSVFGIFSKLHFI